MSKMFPISNFQSPIDLGDASARPSIGNWKLKIGNGFSLVEVLVVVSLLSLIVLALMAVFSNTQKAFRSAVTQTDVLEGSRATVELIASDLRTLTPSGGVSNGPVNFFAADNNAFLLPTTLNYTALLQNLPGTASASTQRTNLLNYFFILGRENTKWTGTGYAVDPNSSGPLYPLYRFYAETNLTISPVTLVNRFFTMVNNGQWTNLNHVLDGVVHLTVFACDVNGYQLTNTYQFNGGQLATNRNIQFYPFNTGYSFYSNAVPASVELELGVMEDSTLARAESLPNNLPAAPPNDRRSLFLKNQPGAVHLFRQRVNIPNVDLSAYQP